MRLSISRTLLAIFILIALLSAVAVAAVGQWVQERSVNALAVSESRRNAELIFQNLYSVMRKGWTKDEIEELVVRINRTDPDLRIAVYRSQQVADDFGDIEADRNKRVSDPLIAEAMAGGGERLAANGTELRFIYPIPVAEECLDCHVSAKPGTINGVIDISFPLQKLRVPLEFTLNSVTLVFAVLIALLFVVTLISIRYLVTIPMSRLAAHIDGIVTSGDLSRRVDGRSFQWLHEVRSLAENFNRLMADLEISRARLVEQSTTDPLTGLSNRRQFQEFYAVELERARRQGQKLAVLMIDLDGFKPINDRWGHATGDTVLRRAAAAMVGHVRVIDMVARVGGDEFAVLAPGTGAEGARALAEKLAIAIQDERVDVSDVRVSVQASIGFGIFPDDGATADEVLNAADEAMYEDKRTRRAAHALA